MDDALSVVGDTRDPIIMVSSSHAAETSCRLNNIGVTDLFRPFNQISGINATIRTGSTDPYVLDVLRVRFISASDIVPIDPASADQFLLQLVALNAADEKFMEQRQNVTISARDDVPAFLTAYKDTLPWMARYRQEFWRSTRQLTAECYDHPVCSVVVASASEDDPIGMFQSLCAPDALPSIFRDQIADPELLRHYVLLHDKSQHVDTARLSELFERMQQTFGAAVCTVLTINSLGAEEEDSSRSNLWNSIRRPNYAMREYDSPEDVGTPGSMCFGIRLSESDVTCVTHFIANLVTHHLVPFLEKKVQRLHEQFVAARGGFKNVVKSWWRSKPESAADTGHQFATPEFRTRQLGDLAFMIHDYELAFKRYRDMAKDLKNDKVTVSGAVSSSASRELAFCRCSMRWLVRQPECVRCWSLRNSERLRFAIARL